MFYGICPLYGGRLQCQKGFGNFNILKKAKFSYIRGRTVDFIICRFFTWLSKSSENVWLLVVFPWRGGGEETTLTPPISPIFLEITHWTMAKVCKYYFPSLSKKFPIACARSLKCTFVFHQFTYTTILHFPIAHNSLCLPPKFCINYYCEMLLGGLHIPKSISQQ